jgi:hypothetical protein
MYTNTLTKTRAMMDGYSGYNGIGKGYISHEVVDHSVKEFARGDVYTNTAESWFAMLKRGVFGTFHHVSDRHLDRCIAKFMFRWDYRKINDFERLGHALKGTSGKRLNYSTNR